MTDSRVFYFIAIVVTIIGGLLSRHFTFIPAFWGDILWGLMVYWIIRFLFTSKPVQFAVIGSLVFSFAIEFSQLYQSPWINQLRQTLFGKLVLGQGFLWSDLLCYAAGIISGAFLEKMTSGRTSKVYAK